MQKDEAFTYFWQGPFSQWHFSNFEIDGVVYNTAEQWMMAEKARLFADDKTLALIIKSTNPKEQKALGRKVASFNAVEWERHAQNIVKKGSFAKFTQNPRLIKLLEVTAGTTLVEASPFDRIWGIGLSEKDPRAQMRDTWAGQNLLGQILTELRLELLGK